MAPQGVEDDLGFLLLCIKHADEMKINWAAVDKERGSLNKKPGKSAKQSWDKILKKYKDFEGGIKKEGTSGQGENVKPGRKRKLESADTGGEGEGESSKKVKSECVKEECEAGQVGVRVVQK